MNSTLLLTANPIIERFLSKVHVPTQANLRTIGEGEGLNLMSEQLQRLLQKAKRLDEAQENCISLPYHLLSHRMSQINPGTVASYQCLHCQTRFSREEGEQLLFSLRKEKAKCYMAALRAIVHRLPRIGIADSTITLEGCKVDFRWGIHLKTMTVKDDNLFSANAHSHAWELVNAALADCFNLPPED